MRGMSAGQRVFWRSSTCTVWVGREGADGSGALVFSGQDTAHLDGYEYSITVPADQFAALRRALGAGPTADVVELVCRHVDTIMARGERAWLDDHGIDRQFTSY